MLDENCDNLFHFLFSFSNFSCRGPFANFSLIDVPIIDRSDSDNRGITVYLLSLKLFLILVRYDFRAKEILEN